MTDNFTYAMLFEMTKKGNQSKVIAYFLAQGVLRATATGDANFMILILKGVVDRQVTMFWAKRNIIQAMQVTIMMLPAELERMVNGHG